MRGVAEREANLASTGYAPEQRAFYLANGKRVSLADSEERLHRLFSHIVPETELSRRMERNRRAFGTYRDAVTAFLRDEDPSDIANRHHVSVRTINSWADGKAAPKAFMSPKRFDADIGNRRRPNPARIMGSSQKMHDLGYLIGVADGNFRFVYLPAKGGRFNATLKSRQFVKEAQRAAKNVLGHTVKETPRSRNGKVFSYQVSIDNADFTQLYNRATNWGSRAPEGLLLRPGSQRRQQMRIGYLKGVVDSNAHMKENNRSPTLRILLNKDKAHTFEYVKGILTELGIPFNDSTGRGSRPQITIRKEGFSRFSQVVGFRDPKHRARLQAALMRQAA